MTMPYIQFAGMGGAVDDPVNGTQLVADLSGDGLTLLDGALDTAKGVILGNNPVIRGLKYGIGVNMPTASLPENYGIFAGVDGPYAVLVNRYLAALQKALSLYYFGYARDQAANAFYAGIDPAYAAYIRPFPLTLREGTQERYVFGITRTQITGSPSGSTNENAPLDYLRYDTRGKNMPLSPTGGSGVTKCWLASYYDANNVYVLSSGYSVTTSPYNENYTADGLYIGWALDLDQPVSLEGNGRYSPAPNSSVSFQYRFADAGRLKRCIPTVPVTPGAEVRLYLCNNMDDESPAWEEAENHRAHEFANTAKTAADWALGIKVEASMTRARPEVGAPGVVILEV